MQRLFSTFPADSPGAGLLFLRLGAGIPLIYFAAESLRGSGSGAPARVALDLVGALAGALLIMGLSTPIACGIATVVELWIQFSKPLYSHVYPLAHILVAVLAVALALLGPGAWSVDARLFGRKLYVHGREVRPRGPR